MRRSMLVFVVVLLLVEHASGDHPPSDRSVEPDRQYRLGLHLQQEGRLAEAIEAYRASLRLDPTRAEAYKRLKEVYSRGRTADQLLAELKQRTDLDATDFVSWNLLGVLRVKRGRWSDALAAL